jgi:hypothetical protein
MNLLQILSKIFLLSYIDRPPLAPSYVFIVDSSEVTFFNSVIEILKYIFTNGLLNERASVAIITYETNVVCFYRFIENSKTTQMLCVSEAFLPAPVKLFLI